jgi:hypothetical protein
MRAWRELWSAGRSRRCLSAPSTPGGHDARRPRLLLTAVFCAADDLLPKRAKNARRRITDAEVITLCVAQAVLGISSDRQFLRAAGRQLAALFPVLPTRDAFWKRRARLTEHIERVMAAFARDCPGDFDDIVLLDSAPVECGRSARRSAPVRAGRRLRLPLQPQPLPLVLGHAVASARRP